IVVLGGEGVVSDAVAAQLQGFTAGTVTRLAGMDRYVTAASVSAALFSPGVPVAFVATGENYPDAIVGAAAAAAKGAPVLLVKPDGVPQATADELTRLKPASIV